MRKHSLTAAQKQKRAMELRLEGKNFDAIAQEVGYATRAGAYKAVSTGLKKTLQEPADELRQLEAERLNELLAGLWPKAVTGDTWSVDRVLGIMERRAKLYGLDKPPERDLGSEMAGFLSGVQTVRGMQAEDLSEAE